MFLIGAFEFIYIVPVPLDFFFELFDIVPVPLVFFFELLEHASNG